MNPTDCEIDTIPLPEDGNFPNNPSLPLLVYSGAFLPFGDVLLGLTPGCTRA